MPGTDGVTITAEEMEILSGEDPRVTAVVIRARLGRTKVYTVPLAMSWHCTVEQVESAAFRALALGLVSLDAFASTRMDVL